MGLLRLGTPTTINQLQTINHLHCQKDSSNFWQLMTQKRLFQNRETTKHESRRNEKSNVISFRFSKWKPIIK